jgi:spore coat protein CotF
MDMEKLVAVSGVSSVMKLVSTKKNGLFLEDFDTKKIRFYSSRKYNFTPLESISIYVEADDDTIPLGDVLGKMKEQSDENPPADVKSSSDDLKAYFEQVLPSYNREQVYVSDIKKIIKWFNYLSERDLLVEKVESDETNVEAVGDVDVEVVE